jgi:uncharacterized protein YidB (DUF937 family)
MGLLDDLLGSVLQGAMQGQQPQPQGRAPGQTTGQPSGLQIDRTRLAGLATAVIAMLNDPRIGGIDGLLRRFQQAGLGDVIGSWVGTGQNQPIDARRLEQLFPDEVAQMSRQAGVPPQQGGSILAQLLPMLIDQLTPGGRVPQQNQMPDLGSRLLKSLLA